MIREKMMSRPVTLHKGDDGSGYLKLTMQNDNEMLVYLISHELRHVWQRENYDTNNGWFTSKLYKRGTSFFDAFAPPACEYDADMYAKKQLERWRKQTKF